MDLRQYFKSLLYLTYMWMNYYAKSTVSYALTSIYQNISHENSTELQTKDERNTSVSALTLAQ